MRKIEERDEFIRTSIGSQVRSTIKKFCFYVGGHAVKVQVWMTYDLGTTSPFEELAKHVKTMDFVTGTIYSITDKKESSSLQITVSCVKGQLNDEEMLTVRQTVSEMVLKILHDADSIFEKKKWDYYGGYVDTMERALFRTIMMCGVSFVAGCIVGATFGMEWVNMVIRIAVIGSGLGAAFHLASKDFYAVKDLKYRYQVGIES